MRAKKQKKNHVSLKSLALKASNRSYKAYVKKVSNYKRQVQIASMTVADTIRIRKVYAILTVPIRVSSTRQIDLFFAFSRD